MSKQQYILPQASLGRKEHFLNIETKTKKNHTFLSQFCIFFLLSGCLFYLPGFRQALFFHFVKLSYNFHQRWFLIYKMRKTKGEGEKIKIEYIALSVKIRYSLSDFNVLYLLIFSLCLQIWSSSRYLLGEI